MTGRHKRRRPPRYGLALGIIFFATVFCFSFYQVIMKAQMARQEQKSFEELAAIKKQTIISSAAQSTPNPTSTPPKIPESSYNSGETDYTDPSISPESKPTPLSEYEPLYAINDDLFGWLTIEAVGIDYPVVHTPDDPEHYLRRAFDGSYSGSGVPFVDGKCPAEGCYYLIYGHHMNNGTMFGRLPDYQDEDFCKEHPVIRFDTLYEHREYVVMAAFFSRIYGKDEQGVFRYYEYFDLSDPAIFEEYVRQVNTAALYDTGITAEYGDELLALSTCNYHTADGRFVVVAKRIS